MAEVILPGEEETSVPEIPGIVLEMPGINSKVIEVSFDALNTRKTTIVNTSQMFFTTDTDAWIAFTLTGLTDATGTYSLVLRNRDDGSTFQRVGNTVDGKAYYKIPEQEIRHAGRWIGQMYVTLENGQTTAAQFGFRVDGHILDGNDVRETVVEDFQTLMAQLQGVKGQAEIDLADLKADLSLSTVEAEQLIADTQELKLIYDELLETGVLQTNINEKLTELETTYAPRLTTLEQNDVSLTAQLQQTTEFLNQLQNIINSEKLTPLFVENMASFGWVGMGLPSGIANYDGGNFFLKISGNSGDSFVTVTEGNIAHAGTGKWAGVIKNDKGEWKTVAVTGSDGATKLNIYPSLTENIVSGEVGNLHDAVFGQHYTERGYYALAQHLYNAKPKNADRNKYIAKFKGTETTSSFAKIGGPYLNYNYSSNISTGDILRSYTSNTLSPLLFGNGTTQGVEWTQNINGKKGFFEAFVGSHADDLTAEFYLDGVLSGKVDNFGAVVKRLTFDYKNADTATFKVYATTQTVDKRLYISECTWWTTELDHSSQLLPPHSKVVYLGDSWGEFHNKAMSRELSRLITKDSYKNVDVINPSVGGMTSAWGLSWFEEYVIKNRPTHVFIEFFTNDLNDSTATFIGPDGVSYSGRVTQEQWKDNVLKMAELAIRYGIQPIIVTPAPTAVINQTQRHANANAYLMAGNSL